MADIVKIEWLGQNKQIVKLKPFGSPGDISLVPTLLAEFDACLHNGSRYFVFDLGDINDLAPSLIALMFEMTAKARRYGGEVEIVNLTPAVSIDLEQFKYTDYLCVGKQESHVIAEFDQTVSNNRIPDQELESACSLETVTIPSRVSDIYQVSDRVVRVASQMGFDTGEISKIRISVYEGCLNAIEHAYHGDPGSQLQVEIEHTSQELQISIIDFGEGFQSVDNREFDVQEAAMNRSRGGMGLHIIKRSMDEVRYEKHPLRGNRLTMVKYLDGNN